MTDVVVCRVEDLPPGERRLVSTGPLEIGVFNIEGEYHALPNVCAHQFGPLCAGKLTGTLRSRADSGWKLQWIDEGRVLTCPWHSLEYDVTTGQCLAYPRVRLRKFPVEIRDGWIVVGSP